MLIVKKIIVAMVTELVDRKQSLNNTGDVVLLSLNNTCSSDFALFIVKKYGRYVNRTKKNGIKFGD